MEAMRFDFSVITNKIISIATDLYYSLPPISHDVTKNTTLIGWNPPPSGFFKLNSDNLARGNPGSASSAAIIRDSNGAWITSCTRRIGQATSMAAELWGIRDGLMLAKNLNIKKLIVEVDAMAIVKFFSVTNSSFVSTHPYSAIISDCRSLLQHFEDAQLKSSIPIGKETTMQTFWLKKENLYLLILLFTPIPLLLFCTSF